MRRLRLLLIATSLAISSASAHAFVAHGYSNVFTISPVSAVNPGDGAPQATDFTNISPNPFNPRVKIEFSLARAGNIELAIFDLRGRLVRSLDREFHPHGNYRATWDGRNESGESMPAGTYFCRLVSATETRTAKLMLIK